MQSLIRTQSEFGGHTKPSKFSCKKLARRHYKVGVYALEKADLVLHNYNRFDLLIADRGQWLLDGLERFSEPPTAEDASGEQNGNGPAEG